MRWAEIKTVRDMTLASLMLDLSGLAHSQWCCCAQGDNCGLSRVRFADRGGGGRRDCG
jgi:hypothetical protein